MFPYVMHKKGSEFTVKKVPMTKEKLSKFFRKKENY